MSTSRISFDVPEQNAQTVVDLLKLNTNSDSALTRVGAHLQNLAQGAYNGKTRVNLGAVQASGTVTFSSVVATDTVTINGVVFTGIDTIVAANQFDTGQGDQASANSLRSVVNASTSAKITGTVKLYRRATLLFSSFAAADYVTINGIVFTGRATPTEGNYYEFAVETSDAGTAQRFMEALTAAAVINPALRDLIGASRSTATITINYQGDLTLTVSAHGTATSTINVVTCLIPGQIGNLCSLAISAHGSVSGAVMTGGTEGTETVFGNHSNAI